MTTIQITVDGKDDSGALLVLARLLRIMQNGARASKGKMWPVYSIGTGRGTGSGTAAVERVDAGGGKQ